jgi:hypothetical protein
MSDPWDRPEQSEGDASPGTTYAAVGQTLSLWEDMEFEFAVLFSIFEGSPGKIALIEEYGVKGRIFEARMKCLEESAAKYFAARCSQELEGDFGGLVDEAYRLAIRRHQIAHGMVTGIDIASNIEATRVRKAYWLTSPMYAVARLNKDGEYFYGSDVILAIGERFMSLSNRANGFGRHLAPPEPWQLWPPLPHRRV